MTNLPVEAIPMRHLILAVLLAVPAAAEQALIPAESIAHSSASMFDVPVKFILQAAKKMPEEKYSYRPVPEVRTFGEVVGHIADGYRLVCSIAAGDKNSVDMRHSEKNAKTKAELLVALEETAAYCTSVHERLSGPAGVEIVDFFGKPYPRVTLLFFNTSHAWEHYGNLVTYMRLNGIVPPSSEPRPAKK